MLFWAMNQPNLKLLSEETGFEVGLDDNLDLKLGPPDLPHQGNHSERQGNVFCGAVPEIHKIRFWKLKKRIGHSK